MTSRPQRPQDNPFDLTKASDFSDSEIAEQWVDLDARGGLLSILKPTLRMPMLLLGGKGSGKTHLMRYCSAPVQAKRRAGDLVKAVKEDGYLGIYIRADALNTDKFAEQKDNSRYWNSIFGMYFELWLATALIGTLAEYAAKAKGVFDEPGFVLEIADLFDTDVTGRFQDIDSMKSYLSRVRKDIDFVVNNSLLRGERPDIQIIFSPGRLAFGIPEVVRDCFPGLRDVLVVYLIDEVENFTAEQQKFLNSLIRYRRGNATIKLGARLYGIKTYETSGAGEPIKRDAEYERVELDNILREQRTEYLGLVSRLVDKRLRSFGTVTQTDELPVSSYFSTLDSRNYFKAVEDDLIKDRGKQERPFHKKLASDLIKAFRIPETEADTIVRALRVSGHLFLEKAATFYFRKMWPTDPDSALAQAASVAKQALGLARNDRMAGAELHEFIAHFGSDILAQLYHDYRRRVPYAGFETLVDLSQGIPRNLLINLKHIYRRSQFAGELPFAGGLISVRAQSDGVRDGAAWFWEDAQPSSGGLQVREAVESLAVLFRTVRFSHAPAECDLCTFSVSLKELTENSRQTLQVAENWSYLVRHLEGRKNKNNRSVDEKYQLGPMLAPRWEVSEHRRGSIELGSDIANAILDPKQRGVLPLLLKKRLERMLAPTSHGIGGLF